MAAITSSLSMVPSSFRSYALSRPSSVTSIVTVVVASTSFLVIGLARGGGDRNRVAHLRLVVERGAGHQLAGRRIDAEGVRVVAAQRVGQRVAVLVRRRDRVGRSPCRRPCSRPRSGSSPLVVRRLLEAQHAVLGNLEASRIRPANRPASLRGVLVAQRERLHRASAVLGVVNGSSCRNRNGGVVIGVCDGDVHGYRCSWTGTGPWQSASPCSSTSSRSPASPSSVVI